jgi:hypothetical protein
MNKEMALIRLLKCHHFDLGFPRIQSIYGIQLQQSKRLSHLMLGVTSSNFCRVKGLPQGKTTQ